MIQSVLALARALRDAGVRLSLAEALDACAGLNHLPLTRREDFRLALQVSLIKDPKDIPLFTQLFDRYFPSRLPGRKRGTPPRRTHQAEGFGGKGEPRQGYGKTKQRPQGEHAPRAGKKQTDNSGKPAAADAATPHEDADTGAALLSELRAEQERARRAAADHCRQQGDAIRQRDLRRRLTAAESREAAAAVEKLAQKLVSRQSLRRRHAWRGSVDLKQTLAHSARSGGVPFQLYHRRRSRARHKLLVLCDVSGSVRHAAALLLHLAHHLQSLFARTHSLVFVDRPVDVTDLFQRFPCAEALQRMSARADLNQNAYSDYGNTFYELLDDYPRLLDRDTVLLILGDARTNQFDPMPWAFAEIRRRIRRILWLNPEPPGRWNTQDSALASYADACDAIFPCNNLAELEQAARALAVASHS